jgi:hypothetical protein
MLGRIGILGKGRNIKDRIKKLSAKYCLFSKIEGLILQG